MSPGEQDDVLIEATVSVYRTLDADGLSQAPPEWWDLSPESRVRAFEAQVMARALESAMDERGWSGTVRAVMARISAL